ncbi:MAG: hypothetical protein AAF196_14320 [Planctomycetota bacterium]
MKFSKLSLLALASLTFLASCESPRARIKGDGEDSIVDDNRAGIAAYDRLVSESTKEMLAWYTDEVLRGNAPQGLQIAFAGIQNSTNEPLGQWRDELNQIIGTTINNYRGFTSVSPRVVSAALRQNGQQVDDLLLPAGRETFLNELRRTDNAVRALVFAQLTSGVSRGGDVREQRYRLTLEMVDTESSIGRSFDATISKEYR